MVKEYWVRVHRRALNDARHALWIETGERAVIAVLLAAVALVLIWWFSDKDTAQHELIVRAAASTAILLAFPFVYVWKAITAPARMDAEARARIEDLSNFRATLAVGDPYQLEDMHGVNRWKIKINNHGPASAAHVQLTLLDVDPDPRDESWHPDYPYTVVQSGLSLDLNECRINRGNAATFDVLAIWRDATGHLLTRLDTTNSASMVRIDQDESWELKYTVSAENGDTVHFTLKMCRVNEIALVVRKS